MRRIRQDCRSADRRLRLCNQPVRQRCALQGQSKQGTQRKFSQIFFVALQTEIAASPVVVWNAITDPAELTRWFSLKAEVRPGNGGSMRLAWDEPVVANWQVEAWEPERRLSVAEMRPLGVALQPSEAGQVARSVDFCLERSDSHTVLRLTHHGFGCGPQWETLFAAVRRGWTFQLLSLRHYLERHAGTDRTVARSMRTSSCILKRYGRAYLKATPCL